MNQMLQLKDTEWLNRLKNKSHLHVAHKRPTSDLKTAQIANESMEKDIPYKWKQKKKNTVVAIFTSNDRDFKD